MGNVFLVVAPHVRKYEGYTGSTKLLHWALHCFLSASSCAVQSRSSIFTLGNDRAFLCSGFPTWILESRDWPSHFEPGAPFVARLRVSGPSRRSARAPMLSSGFAFAWDVNPARRGASTGWHKVGWICSGVPNWLRLR